MPDQTQSAMAVFPGEIIYRIIDDEQVVVGERVLPTITIRGTTIYATTRTVHYRRSIPEGGMRFDDLFRMAGRLGGIQVVSLIWIAAQLNRPEYGGVAGPYVAELATLHGVNLNPVIDQIIQDYAARGIPAPPPAFVPRLITTEAVPADYTCAVCLETRGGEWVTADGCSFHFFHRECMMQWTRRNCITCRRPLL